MSFDIQTVLNDMISAAAQSLAGEWPTIGSCIKRAIEAERDALAVIAQARLAGDITDEDFASQIEDEKTALVDALLACQVTEKLTAQRASQAAGNVLLKAVKTLL